MPNQTPEQLARDRIDAKLRQAGWAVQEKNKIDFSAASGIGIKEYPTQVGPSDYVQNRQQPRLEVLFEIAEILEVKPKDLLKDK